MFCAPLLSFLFFSVFESYQKEIQLPEIWFLSLKISLVEEGNVLQGIFLWDTIKGSCDGLNAHLNSLSWLKFDMNDPTCEDLNGNGLGHEPCGDNRCACYDHR